MRGGQLRKRIDIQRYDNSSRDAHGNPTRNWATMATVWAKIEPLTGKELWQAQQMNSQSNTRITIRYFKGLNEAMRFLYGPPSNIGAPRAFQIVNITDEEERHRMMTCDCIEGAPNG